MSFFFAGVLAKKRKGGCPRSKPADNHLVSQLLVVFALSSS